MAYELITAIPGVSCVKPQAALYMFAKLDPTVYPITDDRQFFLEMLEETRVMLVQGSGFNYPGNHHFRIVFLPHEDMLREAIKRLGEFLAKYRAKAAARLLPGAEPEADKVSAGKAGKVAELPKRA